MVCIATNNAQTAESIGKVSKPKNSAFKKASKSAKKALIAEEFSALRSLLPRVASKEVSSLDVVLEAIDYIQSLENKLIASAMENPEALVASFARLSNITNGSSES